MVSTVPETIIEELIGGEDEPLEAITTVNGGSPFTLLDGEDHDQSKMRLHGLAKNTLGKGAGRSQRKSTRHTTICWPS